MIWFFNELNNYISVSNQSRLLATYWVSSYAIAGLNINSKTTDKKHFLNVLNFSLQDERGRRTLLGETT